MPRYLQIPSKPASSPAGSRTNRALPALSGTFERFGVYTGLVGARFERPMVSMGVLFARL